MTAFLFLDVDGYYPGGVSNSTIVSQDKNGYRPRELGWELFCPRHHSGGSIYFYDDVKHRALSTADKGTWFVNKLIHGLPIQPTAQTFGDDIAIPSHHLLDAIAFLCKKAERASDNGVVVAAYKGGSEGIWISKAYPEAIVLDLCEVGCPKVDNIALEHPEWILLAGGACAHHTPCRRRKGSKHATIVHCPRLEVKLMAMWVGLSGDVLPSM